MTPPDEPRPPEVVQIEFRRRNDIRQCVRDYVAAITDGAIGKDAAAFAGVRFADEDKTVRRLLIILSSQIVDALAEGNHIAYGISRKEFADYKAALERLDSSI